MLGSTTYSKIDCGEKTLKLKLFHTMIASVVPGYKSVFSVLFFSLTFLAVTQNTTTFCILNSLTFPWLEKLNPFSDVFQRQKTGFLHFILHKITGFPTISKKISDFHYFKWKQLGPEVQWTPKKNAYQHCALSHIILWLYFWRLWSFWLTFPSSCMYLNIELLELQLGWTSFSQKWKLLRNHPNEQKWLFF